MQTILSAFEDPCGFFQRAWEEYGDIVLIRFGPVRYYLVNDPSAIHHVLVEAAANYPKSRTYRAFMPLVGRGLLTSEGELWKRQRRLVQPAFHRDCLAGFADTMVTEAKKTLDAFGRRSGEVVDVHAEMGRTHVSRGRSHPLRRGSRVGRGRGGGRAQGGPPLHRGNATSLAPLPSWVPTPGNRRFLRARRTLESMVDRIVEERRVKRDGPRDLMALLVSARDEQSGEGMSPTQLRDEVMTLALAGYETTANALTWALHLISGHPDVSAAMLEEVERVLGDRNPTFEDLPRLSYLRMVVEEALRLFPPVWKIERQAIEDDVILGYRVPRGSIVGITMHTLHRHPAYWERAEEFDPLRFTKERAATRPRHAYLPFGGGKRVCIGAMFATMEAQIVLAMMMRRFRIERLPDHAPEIEPTVTLHPRAGLPMRVVTRASA